MHTIRLRDPWQAEHLADGRVRWTRRFNRPTGLAPADRVTLEIEGLPPTATVDLNAAALAPLAPAATPDLSSFDVAALLRDANLIGLTTPQGALREPADRAGAAAPFPLAARLVISPADEPAAP